MTRFLVTVHDSVLRKVLVEESVDYTAGRQICEILGISTKAFDESTKVIITHVFRYIHDERRPVFASQVAARFQMELEDIEILLEGLCSDTGRTEYRRTLTDLHRIGDKKGYELTAKGLRLLMASDEDLMKQTAKGMLQDGLLPATDEAADGAIARAVHNKHLSKLARS